VWVPPVGLGRPLRRVARPAEDGAVADVKGRATDCERDDVIDGQVARRVAVTLVGRAPVAVLATPCPEYSRTQALPLPCAVQGVMPAVVRLSGVLGAPTAGSAGGNAAHRAELHGSRRPCGVSDLTLVTLVTLDCSPSTSAWVPWPAGAGSNRAQGILRPHQRLKKPLRRVASPLRSVKPVRAAVYSPTVLRPRDHARAPCSASPLWLRS
jgi:hypothetical protein